MDRQKISRHNFIFLTLEGVTYLSALAFIDTSSIVPLFIDTYTGSLVLAGLATTIKSVVFFIPQILMGPFMHRIKNVPSFVAKTMIIFRPLPILMVPVLLLGIKSYMAVWIFLLFFTLMCAGDGLLNIPWLDLFNRTIPAEKRGKLFGYQQLFSGLGNIVGGIVIKVVLDSKTLQSNVKFSIIFGIAGVLCLLSGLFMVPAKDLPRDTDNDSEGLLSFYKKLPVFLKDNKDFARLIIIQIISGFTGVVAPFVILFNKNYIRLDAGNISILVYIQIIGTLLGGVIWGHISHRFGNRLAIIASQSAGLIIGVVAIISYFTGIKSFLLISCPMAFFNGTYISYWIGFTNYLMDIVEEKSVPIYLTLTNILMFPNTFLFYLAGLAAGKWGYMPLFAANVLAGTLVVILSLKLKTVKEIADMNQTEHVE